MEVTDDDFRSSLVLTTVTDSVDSTPPIDYSAFDTSPPEDCTPVMTNRCTQTQLIIKIPCTQLKYLSTHCNPGRA
jgi:hypothetical protein